MSSGVVHTRASLLLAGGFLIGTFIAKDWNLIQASIGSLFGILVSPDLDVDGGFSADKYIRDKIGGVGEKVWRAVWWGYSTSLKHGSFLSHFPVIGTAGRILYMMLPYLLISMVFMSWDIRPQIMGWLDMLYRYRLVVLGLMASDLIHYCLDVLTTEHKKKTPKGL